MSKKQLNSAMRVNTDFPDTLYPDTGLISRQRVYNPLIQETFSAAVRVTRSKTVNARN